MKRRAFFGTTLAGVPVAGAMAAPPKPKTRESGWANVAEITVLPTAGQ